MDEPVKISTRKKPEPLPTPPAAATAPTHLTAQGIKGQLPLGQKAYVVPTSLTPSERAMWEKHGYKPGEPLPVPEQDLPPEYAQQVAEIRRDASENLLPPAPLNTPALEVPEPIDVRTLPKDRQAEIYAAMDQVRAQYARDTAAPLPNVDMSVSAAARGEGVTVVDDRKERKAAQPAPQPTPEPTDETQGGSEEDVARCPHCNWPQNVQDPIEVTLEDKRLFLLSGRGPLFRKDYPAHGGQTVVRIRELTPKEVDMCYLQANREVLRNEISTLDYKERVFRLRVSLQLNRITFADGYTQRLPEKLADWDVDYGEDDTKVRGIADYVYDNVLNSESLHRQVCHLVGKFNSLRARLEAHVEDSDFWPRTASPAS